MPSSPNGPWTMGKTTSSASSATIARSAPGASTACGVSRAMVRSGFRAGWATRCASARPSAGRAAVSRAPAITAAADSVDGGRSAMDQRPDLSMKSGTGS